MFRKLFAAAAWITTSVVGEFDAEYHNWASKVVDYDDEEALRLGKEMGCMWCNLAINGVRSQHKANLERAKWEKFTEQEVIDTMLKMCTKMSSHMARQIEGHASDMMMLCRRVFYFNLNHVFLVFPSKFRRRTHDSLQIIVFF